MQIFGGSGDKYEIFAYNKEGNGEIQKVKGGGFFDRNEDLGQLEGFFEGVKRSTNPSKHYKNRKKLVYRSEMLGVPWNQKQEIKRRAQKRLNESMNLSFESQKNNPAFFSKLRRQKSFDYPANSSEDSKIEMVPPENAFLPHVQNIQGQGFSLTPIYQVQPSGSGQSCQKPIAFQATPVNQPLNQNFNADAYPNYVPDIPDETPLEETRRGFSLIAESVIGTDYPSTESQYSQNKPNPDFTENDYESCQDIVDHEHEEFYSSRKLNRSLTDKDRYEFDSQRLTHSIPNFRVKYQNCLKNGAKEIYSKRTSNNVKDNKGKYKITVIHPDTEITPKDNEKLKNVNSEGRKAKEGSSLEVQSKPQVNLTSNVSKNIVAKTKRPLGEKLGDKKQSLNKGEKAEDQKKTSSKPLENFNFDHFPIDAKILSKIKSGYLSNSNKAQLKGKNTKISRSQVAKLLKEYQEAPHKSKKPIYHRQQSNSSTMKAALKWANLFKKPVIIIDKVHSQHPNSYQVSSLNRNQRMYLQVPNDLKFWNMNSADHPFNDIMPVVSSTSQRRTLKKSKKQRFKEPYSAREARVKKTKPSSRENRHRTEEIARNHEE